MRRWSIGLMPSSFVADPLGCGVVPLFQMAERLNCRTECGTTEIRCSSNKVAGFIIVGGQEQYSGSGRPDFFAELGFIFPQSLYRPLACWSHEDMEKQCCDRAATPKILPTAQPC